MGKFKTLEGWMSVRKNLVVDAVAFAGLLIVLDPRLTGIAIHEWFSVAFAALLVFHLAIHWSWLTSAVKRFVKTIPLTRGKLVLNALIFIGFTVATMSGFMISESILELFGVRRSMNFSWREVHEISSNLTLLLVGIHVALNWTWVRNAFRRLTGEPLPGRQIVVAQLARIPVSDNNESER